MDIPYRLQAIASHNHLIFPKTLNNDKHPYKRMRVDEYGALGKTTYITDILVR